MGRQFGPSPSLTLTARGALCPPRPNRAGSLYPASGDAGSAEAMESDILLIQLWVPTAAVGASRRGSSAAVYCARLRMGDRSRSGKILRISVRNQSERLTAIPGIRMPPRGARFTPFNAAADTFLELEHGDFTLYQ